VTFERILHGDREPQNWLSYSGTLMNQRFSPLTQITAANVKNLQQQWVWQAKSLEKFEATPLVVDGVMYTGAGAERRRWRSTPSPAACSGPMPTRRRPRGVRAAAGSTAASPSWATRFTWARSTRISSPSTPRAASRCGTPWWRRRRIAIRSRPSPTIVKTR
jgi:hypothetical protein